jgi:hypothetical protein
LEKTFFVSRRNCSPTKKPESWWNFTISGRKPPRPPLAEPTEDIADKVFFVEYEPLETRGIIRKTQVREDF